MPKATFIADDGSEITLEVPVGRSLMQAAVLANLSGILGECGGSLNCGTCHVFVHSAKPDSLPAISLVEEEMLEATATQRQLGSRLSCQLFMTAELEGIVIRLPPSQV